MFYSYYRKHGTAKATHVRAKDDYATGKSEKTASHDASPESAIEDDSRPSSHVVISNHANSRQSNFD